MKTTKVKKILLTLLIVHLPKLKFQTEIFSYILLGGNKNYL